MPDLIRLPRHFFDDHASRDLPTPAVVRSTRSHVFVRADDPELPELLDDARYYADSSVGWDPTMRGLSASARAIVRILTPLT